MMHLKFLSVRTKSAEQKNQNYIDNDAVSHIIFPCNL